MATNNNAKSIAAGVMAAVAAALLAASSAQAQLYRWTDPSGRVHFTDTPPPANAKNVQKKRVPAPAEKTAPSEPFSVQQARKNSPVTLYTAPGCQPCAAARKLLGDRGVPFKEVSVVDEAGAEALKKAAGGGTVPAIVVGSSTQMGFDQDTYQGLLDAAGYPKPGILPPKNPPPAPGSGGAGAPPSAPPPGR